MLSSKELAMNMSRALDMPDWSNTICDVWSGNFFHEGLKIKWAIGDGRFTGAAISFTPRSVTMKTSIESLSDLEEVRDIAVNFDEAIQVGVTLFDSQGNLARTSRINYATWQFNLRLTENQTKMLRSGDFTVRAYEGFRMEKHLSGDAIDRVHFVTMLQFIGLIKNSKVKWFTFSGGQDLSFISNLIWNTSFDGDTERQKNSMQMYVPEMYDAKLILLTFLSVGKFFSDAPTENKEELSEYLDKLGLSLHDPDKNAGTRSKLIALLLSKSGLIAALPWDAKWDNYNYKIFQ